MKINKISKKYKKLISLSLVLSIFLFLFLNIYFSYLYHYKGKEINEEWNNQLEWNEEDIKIIQKEEGKDFVILNFADIQLADLEDIFHRSTIKKELDYLVRNVKPDLITLTGDQTWSNENLVSLKAIIRWLESYKIPYAPIFGNHDYGNGYNTAVASMNYCCDLYENAKYCLLDRGPSNIGDLGNYVVVIKENEKMIQSLYFLNTGYQYEITKKQIDWVKWNASGIAKANNDIYVSGMCFTHQPMEMFEEAYDAYLLGNANSYTEVLVESALFGCKDNGFYEEAKKVGITHFVCGHQHTNTFSIDYDDCVFTFALKTGELSYYYDDGNRNYNGATSFTIKSDGSIQIQNHYVEKGKFHIKNSVNQYNE